MSYSVPNLSIEFILLNLFCSVAFPVAMLVYLRRRKRADWLPFPVGCAVFLLFAMALEGVCNNLLFLRTPFGETLLNTPILYALTGGLMAGLFEETGRYIAFSTVLRPRLDKDENALMYGAGHGGIEMLAVLGVASVNNLVYAIAINSGEAVSLLETVPAETRDQLEAVFFQLAETPSWQFLLGLLERVFALVLHLSCSVVVWFAAKKPGKRRLYPVAIGMHLAVDAISAYLSRTGVPLPVTEAAVCLLSVAAALYARRVWNICRTEQ